MKRKPVKPKKLNSKDRSWMTTQSEMQQGKRKTKGSGKEKAKERTKEKEKERKATKAKGKEDSRKAERIPGESRIGTSSSRGSAPGTIRCPGGSGSMGTKETGTKEEKAKAKEKERATTGATTARGTATRDGDAGG